MAIRDKLERNIQSYLEPGEKVEAAFPVTGGASPYLLLVTGYLLSFWVKWVIVAVTDRRIIVLEASMLGTTKPKRLVGSFPRETELGPVSGTYGKITLGGTRYYVHRRFHQDVATADSSARAPHGLAPGTVSPVARMAE